MESFVDRAWNRRLPSVLPECASSPPPSSPAPPCGVLERVGVLVGVRRVCVCVCLHVACDGCGWVVGRVIECEMRSESQKPIENVIRALSGVVCVAGCE